MYLQRSHCLLSSYVSYSRCSFPLSLCSLDFSLPPAHQLSLLLLLLIISIITAPRSPCSSWQPHVALVPLEHSTTMGTNHSPHCLSSPSLPLWVFIPLHSVVLFRSSEQQHFYRTHPAAGSAKPLSRQATRQELLLELCVSRMSLNNPRLLRSTWAARKTSLHLIKSLN